MGDNGAADVIAERTGSLEELGIPRQGHVLATVAETYGGPIRKAVEHISRSFNRNNITSEWRSLYGCRHPEPGGGIVRPVPVLAAWMIVAAWVIGVATRANIRQCRTT